MASPRSGDTVRVHYTGTLDDGRVFDSSRDRDPMEFTVGQGQIIPGFERAITEMEPGDEKTVTIPADQAYGTHRPELLVAVKRAEFPTHIEPTVGSELQVTKSDGDVTVVRVANVSDQAVTLDANHPLAGEDLTFDLELVEVVSAR